MKTKFFIILLMVFINNLCKSQDTIATTKLQKYQVVGFSPSKKVENTTVLIKYFDDFEEGFKSKKVNGLCLGLNIIGIFLPPLILFNLPELGKGGLTDFGSSEKLPGKMNKINGLQFSIINMEPTTTNGLEINIASNIGTLSKTNGVSLSPIFNIHHTSNGIAIATFANVSQKCRGLQIGLINSCKNSKGIQIGFWNENEKRKMPLINWNFKTKKT